jgi:hypothetical protein
MIGLYEVVRRYGMNFLTTKEASILWGITVRRVQALCKNGQITGLERFADRWMIPKGTPKPIDGRTKAAKQNQRGKENLSG